MRSARPPIASAAVNENVAPSSTIAARRSDWKANVIPGCASFGMRSTFPTTRPNSTAKITSPTSFPVAGGTLAWA
jgi:hypothetical protein